VEGEEEEEEEENAQRGEERDQRVTKIIGAWEKWMGGRNGKVVYTIFASLEEWIWMVADDRWIANNSVWTIRMGQVS